MNIIKFALLGTILLLVGCNNSEVVATLTLPSRNPKETSTQAPMITATLSPTHTPTHPTQEPMTTPTRKFVTATSVPAEVLSLIASLYENNSNCRFPCWWGIIPGKTTLTEAVGRMETFISSWYEYTNYADRVGITYYDILFYIPVESGDGQVLHGFLVSVRNEDNVIESISHDMDADHKELYLISEIFSEYGKPESVILSGNVGGDKDGGYFVNVYMYYSRHGFLSIHTLKAESEESKAGSTEICASHQTYSGLILWDPESNISLGTLSDMWPGYWYGDFYSLDDVSSLSIDEFYNAFTDVDSQCFMVNTEVLY